MSQSHLSICFYQNKVSDKTSHSTNQRAPQLINLGITNRKVDQLPRITLTGRCGLNLISTSTQSMSLSNSALKSIGKLLMYIIDFCIPETPYPDIFKCSSRYEKNYISLFGKQLLITKEMGLERFNIPAISIVVNRDLNPHYDSMNPFDKSDDMSCSVNIEIPTNKLPSNIQETVKKQYPKSIPLCVVMYKRKALIYYSRRMLAVEDYVSESPGMAVGRAELVSRLRNVNAVNDYIGNFFDRHDRDSLLDQFQNGRLKTFTGKALVVKEGVDKMVRVIISSKFIYYTHGSYLKFIFTL